jgi:hypothetical protein
MLIPRASAKTVLVCCFVIVSGSASFGATVACFTSGAVSGSRTNQVAGVPIAAAGPGDDFASLDSTTPAGCHGTDIAFLNLAVDAAASPTDGTYMSTLTNQALATGPVVAVFSAVRGSDSNGGNTNNNDGSNNWTDNGTAPSPTPITTSYEVDSTVAMYSFALNLLGVQLGKGGGTLGGEFDLCLGAAFVGGFGGTCAGTEETFSLSPGVYNYYEVLAGGFTTVGVANNFILTGTGTGTGVTFLTSFEEDFDAPEPSTFATFRLRVIGPRGAPPA